jgi:hypothetical protein
MLRLEMKHYISIFLFAFCVSAQIPPFPVTPTNTVSLTHTNSGYASHLPALSPDKYMLFTCQPSIAAAEYKFYLSPTITPWNPTLILVHGGSNFVVPLDQYPVGFVRYSYINNQGIEGPLNYENP